MEWRAIETAPKDWTTLILFNGEDVFAGYYSCEDGGYDCWMEDQGMGSCQVWPTHWMPLPSPPVA